MDETQASVQSIEIWSDGSAGHYMPQDASQEYQVPSKVPFVGEWTSFPIQLKFVLFSCASDYDIADVGHADTLSMESPSLVLSSKPNLFEPGQGVPHASWASISLH